MIKFKGGALKSVRDYPFMITHTLEKFGIKDDKDQQIIIKHIKSLVKKTKKVKKVKHKKSSSSDDDDVNDSDDSNSNSKSDSDNVDVWK